jgi:phosphoglycolate phosphatase-like HAD superfamily hydrolase
MISLASLQAAGSLVFDSDGTVLNTLDIKRSISSEVFRALGFTDWHVFGQEFANLSGSRASKIKVLETKYGLLIDSERFDSVFTDCLVGRSNEIEIRDGLSRLRDETLENRWYLLTNGSQDETRKLYEKLGISHFFDGGIWGSPEDKSAHMQRLDFGPRDLMLSDSHEDYVLSQNFQIPFVYLAGWNSAKDAAYFQKAGFEAHFTF